MGAVARRLGPSFRALLFGRGGGAVSELGKLEDGYFSCRFRKHCGALPCGVATLSWKRHQVCTRHWLVRHCRPLGLRCVTRIRPEASVECTTVPHVGHACEYVRPASRAIGNAKLFAAAITAAVIDAPCCHRALHRLSTVRADVYVQSWRCCVRPDSKLLVR